MLRGAISAVLSSDEARAREIAERLGKRARGEEGVYYRKVGELVRSVLVPGNGSFLDLARAVSISSSFYLYMPQFTWAEGELALLVEAAGIQGVVMAEDRRAFSKYFGELAMSKYLSDFRELDVEVPDVGIVYVDRAFNVRGVGLVALGYAMTQIAVHDELVAFPGGKRVEVKSIQVLDEDQDAVGPGARVGLALKGASLEEIREAQALLKPGVKTTRELKYVKFKWSEEPRDVHVFIRGVKAMGRAEGDTIKLNGEIPAAPGRALVVNVNARPKKPRVVGYAEL